MTTAIRRAAAIMCGPTKPSLTAVALGLSAFGRQTNDVATNCAALVQMTQVVFVTALMTLVRK